VISVDDIRTLGIASFGPFRLNAAERLLERNNAPDGKTGVVAPRSKPLTHRRKIGRGDPTSEVIHHARSVLFRAGCGTRRAAPRRAADTRGGTGRGARPVADVRREPFGLEGAARRIRSRPDRTSHHSPQRRRRRHRRGRGQCARSHWRARVDLERAVETPARHGGGIYRGAERSSGAPATNRKLCRRCLPWHSGAHGRAGPCGSPLSGRARRC
jgi:hypothetical protein